MGKYIIFNITVEINPIKIKKRLEGEYLDTSTDSYDDAVNKALKKNAVGICLLFILIKAIYI